MIHSKVVDILVENFLCIFFARFFIFVLFQLVFFHMTEHLKSSEKFDLINAVFVCISSIFCDTQGALRYC